MKTYLSRPNHLLPVYAHNGSVTKRYSNIFRLEQPGVRSCFPGVNIFGNGTLQEKHTLRSVIERPIRYPRWSFSVSCKCSCPSGKWNATLHTWSLHATWLVQRYSFILDYKTDQEPAGGLLIFHRVHEFYLGQKRDNSQNAYPITFHIGEKTKLLHFHLKEKFGFHYNTV